MFNNKKKEIMTKEVKNQSEQELRIDRLFRSKEVINAKRAVDSIDHGSTYAANARILIKIAQKEGFMVNNIDKGMDILNECGLLKSFIQTKSEYQTKKRMYHVLYGVFGDANKSRLPNQ